MPYLKMELYQTLQQSKSAVSSCVLPLLCPLSCCAQGIVFASVEGVCPT